MAQQANRSVEYREPARFMAAILPGIFLLATRTVPPLVPSAALQEPVFRGAPGRGSRGTASVMKVCHHAFPDLNLEHPS